MLYDKSIAFVHRKLEENKGCITLFRVTLDGKDDYYLSFGDDAVIIRDTTGFIAGFHDLNTSRYGKPWYNNSFHQSELDFVLSKLENRKVVIIEATSVLNPNNL